MTVPLSFALPPPLWTALRVGWVHTKCCAELCNKKMSRRAVFPTLPLRCSSEAALHDSGLGLASVIKAETTFLLPQRTNDAIAATGDLFYIGPSWNSFCTPWMEFSSNSDTFYIGDKILLLLLKHKMVLKDICNIRSSFSYTRIYKSGMISQSLTKLK